MCGKEIKSRFWIAGSVTSDWLTTVTDFQESQHASFNLDDTVSVKKRTSRHGADG